MNSDGRTRRIVVERSYPHQGRVETVSNVQVPGIGFIFWWRASPRRRNAFFYFAMSTWILTYVILLVGMIAWDPARPWIPLLALSFVFDLYLVRERLPQWAWPFRRSGVPLLDVEARAASPASAEIHPRDPLTDPYDAASFQGAHAPPANAHASQGIEIRIAPPATISILRRATASAVKAARRDLRTGERMRVWADIADPTGSRIQVRFQLAGPGASIVRVDHLGDTFLTALRKRLPQREVELVG